MKKILIDKPINLLEFAGKEEQQFLVSMANRRQEFDIMSRIQRLYEMALSHEEVDESDMVVFQLLIFIHYHFLFANACLMRCHLSEAFASARVAIDAALIAAQIIHDRQSQIAYSKREKPFDKLNRHLKNLIKDKKPLPHKLVPVLIDLHDKFSSFASHADVYAFAHRTDVSQVNGRSRISVFYFQFADNDIERRIHALSLLYAFVLVLDVFADFLINEQKLVDEEWREVLHATGQAMERMNIELRQQLPPDATAPAGERA